VLHPTLDLESQFEFIAVLDDYWNCGCEVIAIFHMATPPASIRHKSLVLERGQKEVSNRVDATTMDSPQ